MYKPRVRETSNNYQCGEYYKVGEHWVQWEHVTGNLLPSEAAREGFSEEERLKIKGEYKAHEEK